MTPGTSLRVVAQLDPIQQQVIRAEIERVELARANLREAIERLNRSALLLRPVDGAILLTDLMVFVVPNAPELPRRAEPVFDVAAGNGATP